MSYVALYVLSFLLFSQTLRLAQKKNADMFTVAAINYVVAAVICVTYLAILGFPDFHSVKWEIWLAGFFNVFTLFFTLLSLSVVAAVVFFPTSLCSVIVFNLMISWMLWRERSIKRQI